MPAAARPERAFHCRSRQPKNRPLTLHCAARLVPTHVPSRRCPFYWQVPLSFALEPRVFAEVARFGADLIHCTSPGAMCFAAWCGIALGAVVPRQLRTKQQEEQTASHPKADAAFRLAPRPPQGVLESAEQAPGVLLPHPRASLCAPENNHPPTLGPGYPPATRFSTCTHPRPKTHTAPRSPLSSLPAARPFPRPHWASLLFHPSFSDLPRYGVGWLAGAVWGAIRSIHGAATLTVAASGALAAELVAEGASPALRTKARREAGEQQQGRERRGAHACLHCGPAAGVSACCHADQVSPGGRRRLSELASHPCARPPSQEWRKAVDSEAFHPRHRSAAMRARLLSPSGATASTSAPADAPTDDAPADAPLLLYVGRLGHEKNLPFLCGVLRRCPGARLAVVGDGPARAEVEAQLAEAAPGRVRFLGCLKGAELGAAFASADVFVMPSETETLGFVVLEAMASGLPVVAVRAGGIPDIVTRDGENGFLYAPGDEEGAARAVRRLARSEALRRRVGAAAREESARWDWAAATGHMLETQYPLVRSRRARRALRSYRPLPDEPVLADGGPPHQS